MAEDEDFREPHLRHADFLGAFAVMESARGILMVQNRRRIDGRDVPVWDLPGGQVEPGESLHDALRRELAEEVGVAVAGHPAFLFVQEGRRTMADRTEYMWRSFFFRVEQWHGEPAATDDVLACAWHPRAALAALLTAPYHDSFRRWLDEGGTFFASRWAD